MIITFIFPLALVVSVITNYGASFCIYSAFCRSFKTKTVSSKTNILRKKSTDKNMMRSFTCVKDIEKPRNGT